MTTQDVTVDDLKKTVTEGIENIKSSLKKEADAWKEASEKKASQEEVEAIKKSLKGEVEVKLKGLEEAVDGLLTKAGRLAESATTEVKSISQEIREAFERKGADGKTTLLDSVKAGQKQAFEIKAATTMTRAYAVGSSGTQRIPVWDREPGVAKAPDRNPFILDLITIGSTTSNAIEWVERTLREGTAGQVAEGASPGLLSMVYETFNAKVKKTAVMLRVTREMLEDVDFLQSEIQTEGLDAMEIQIDEQVFKGSGSGENLKGILEYATAFAKPTGLTAVVSANQIDVLNAAAVQIQNANFRATHYVLHPTDLLAINNVKDDNKNYLGYPGYNRDSQTLNGLPVITNLGVTQGQFLVADFPKAKYVRRKGIIIEMFDQNGTDAETGHVMVRCEARGVHYIKEAHKAAFVKGTFAAGITALSS